MPTKLLKITCCLVFLFGMNVKWTIAASIKIEDHSKNTLTIFDQLQSKKVEKVIITLPIDSLMVNKNTNKSFDASFTYWDQNGQAYKKNIKVKPRGKSRRRHCSFSPLRLTFAKEDLRHHGLRDKHRSLKLVTHCNLSESANANVLKEYLTYKIYNQITDYSLQVQLLQITYKDTESSKTMEYYGFLLEDIDALAERLGGKESNTYGKMMTDFEPTNADHFTLFQFMIGNEDWEIPVRRNLKYIHLEQEDQFLLIPYDFDMTGLVAVEYARPNTNLGMQAVTQRFFMGNFKNKVERKKALSHFRSKRKPIYQLIRDCDLLSSTQRVQMREYLNSFFFLIKDPLLLSRALPYGDKMPEKTALDGTMSVL